jgi:hypothetical protein
MDLAGDSKMAREEATSDFAENLRCVEEHRTVVALIVYRCGLSK